MAGKLQIVNGPSNPAVGFNPVRVSSNRSAMLSGVAATSAGTTALPVLFATGPIDRVLTCSNESLPALLKLAATLAANL